MQGLCWLGNELLASHKELSPMMLVTFKHQQEKYIICCHKSKSNLHCSLLISCLLCLLYI
jgi:hypothetical protein